MGATRTAVLAAALILACAPGFAADDPTAKLREKGDKAAAKERPGWEGPRVEQGTIAADSLSRSDYKAEKARIEADAKAARAGCKELRGGERKACRAQAKNDEKVAKDKLEARRKQSAGARKDLRAANAMEYDKAKEQCEARTGEEKRACLKEARAAHQQARSQKKAQ